MFYNQTKWAQLINQTSKKPVMIENCHQGAWQLCHALPTENLLEDTLIGCGAILLSLSPDACSADDVVAYSKAPTPQGWANGKVTPRMLQPAVSDESYFCVVVMRRRVVL